MTVCVKWFFYIQKPRYFTKSKKLELRLYIHKYRHFIYLFFHWILKIGLGEGDIFLQKKFTLGYTFFLLKTMHFEVSFLYIKPGSLSYILICKEECTFSLHTYIYFSPTIRGIRSKTVNNFSIEHCSYSYWLPRHPSFIHLNWLDLLLLWSLHVPT